MTVAKLKAALGDRDLDQAGLKAALKERLVAHLGL